MPSPKTPLIASGDATRGGSRDRFARGETGAPSSNTAPSQDKSPITVLHQGVDSLYLSYPGDLPEDLDAVLSQLKARSASPDKGEQSLALIELGGLNFHVLDRGARRFKFVLSHADFHLQVSSSSSKSMPLASVQVRSHFLTGHGVESALEALGSILRDLGAGTEPAYWISRADLCIDFAAGWDLLSWDEESWLTHAAKIARYSERGVGSGWTIGARRTLSARLYNKCLEMRAKGLQRPELIDVWRKNGWDGESQVYRQEFEARKEFLNGLKIQTWDDLKLLCGPIWTYLTVEWLRLVVPNPSDSKRCRWPLHSVWSALSQVPWPDNIGQPIERSAPAYQPSADYAIRQARSALTSFMAVRLMAEGGDALSALYQEMLEGLAPIARHRGVPTESLLFDEAALKATKAGKPFASVARTAAQRSNTARRAVQRRVTKKRTRGDGGV